MKEKKYFRNCPQCNITLGHTTNKVCESSKKEGKLCNSCGRKGKLHWNYTGATEPKTCIDCEKEINFRSVRCKSCNRKRIIEEQGINPKFLNSKRNEGMKHSKETLKLMSVSAINERRVKNLHPVNYNKDSIVVLEKFGRDNNLNLQHAENKGEFVVEIPDGNTYFVDGYDKDKNVVVEYIENSSWHKSPKKKIYHLLRREEIKNYLKCEYYEICE
jgi:hypothetical protein